MLLAFAARSLPPEVLALSRFRADQFASRRRWLVPAILAVAVLLSLALAYLVFRVIGAALGSRVCLAEISEPEDDASDVYSG